MEGKRSISVDENDDEFVTKYIAEKNGLSAGWRGFAIDHQLVDGDALVFQLIDSTTFKVYIIRVNDEANNESDMNDKENHVEINKNQEENVSEGVVKEKEEAGSRV